MRTLDLNLASRPFKNDTLPWVGLGLAVIALALLTAWNVRSYRQNSAWVDDLKQQYSATRAELEQFDRRERGAQRGIEGYDLGALHVRADKANEFILWKAFSWTRLFNLLQEVLPNDVQMISIRPIFRPQGADKSRNDELAGRVPVSVEGVAKSLKAFLGFERALIAHANFDRVEPEGHTQSRTGSLAFELKFLYDPEVTAAATELPTPAEEVKAAAAEAPDQEAPLQEAPLQEEPVQEEPEATPGEVAENVGSFGGQPLAPAEFGLEDPGTPTLAQDAAAAGDLPPPPFAEGGPPADADARSFAAPPPSAGAKKQGPTPPGTRRRGKRRKTSGDEQEDGP